MQVFSLVIEFFQFFSQTDYRRVNYRLVGEGRASTVFEVDNINCQLSLRNALSTDTAELYTVRTLFVNGNVIWNKADCHEEFWKVIKTDKSLKGMLVQLDEVFVLKNCISYLSFGLSSFQTPHQLKAK